MKHVLREDCRFSEKRVGACGAERVDFWVELVEWSRCRQLHRRAPRRLLSGELGLCSNSYLRFHLGVLDHLLGQEIITLELRSQRGNFSFSVSGMVERRRCSCCFAKARNLYYYSRETNNLTSQGVCTLHQGLAAAVAIPTRTLVHL